MRREGGTPNQGPPGLQRDALHGQPRRGLVRVARPFQGRAASCPTVRWTGRRPSLLRRGRTSIRLKGYDYTQAGSYFVNLCTWQRACLFGDVVDGEMVLSRCGQVAAQKWRDIPRHFPNAALDEWVVMSNHIYGITWIIDQSMETCRGEAFPPGISTASTDVPAQPDCPPDQVAGNASPGMVPTISTTPMSATTQPDRPPDQVAGHASPSMVPTIPATPISATTQPDPLPDQVAGNASPDTVITPNPGPGEAFATADAPG
jgi:hypothetical protein